MSLRLQIALVKKWNDVPRGVSVNVGLVTGGTRPNVIPDHARAVMDLRALRIADMRKIEKQLRGFAAHSARRKAHGARRL